VIGGFSVGPLNEKLVAFTFAHPAYFETSAEPHAILN